MDRIGRQRQIDVDFINFLEMVIFLNFIDWKYFHYYAWNWQRFEMEIIECWVIIINLCILPHTWECGDANFQLLPILLVLEGLVIWVQLKLNDIPLPPFDRQSGFLVQGQELQEVNRTVDRGCQGPSGQWRWRGVAVREALLVSDSQIFWHWETLCCRGCWRQSGV